MKTSIEEVKTVARGRWRSILTDAGVPRESLTGKNVPCPKCGGTDRFAAFKDVAETGGVNCRKCHNKRNGDGIATVQWWRDCPFQEALAFVAERLGLDRAQPKPNGKPRIIATYEYRDEKSELLFQVVRYQPKDFRQRRPRLGGGWDWSVKGVRTIPYRLDKLAAEPSRPVMIVEGEKDVDNLSRIDVLATCNAGGASKWTSDHSEFLRNRKTIILPDNDEAGCSHAQEVARSLYPVAASVGIVELPGLPAKGDPSDWIAAGGKKEQLKRLIAAAPTWTPESAQAWPDINWLDKQGLPEFPTHALPDILRQWVEAKSHATQTPADLAAWLVLAVCSAAIARRVIIEPRPGWEEPVNLFTAVLLEPGNRKSAVFSDAMKPLRELEAEFIEAARPRVAREQSDRRQDETRLKNLEKTAAEKGDATARQEACNLAAELAKQTESVLPRLLVDDATSEKLGMMLAQQGGRIASMSPEGGVFDLMAGLYSKSGMPQFGVYMMGHSGDDLIVDRVSRRSVHVECPALTCAYAMQPAVIEGLAEKAAFRGRGLLARFLYAAPQSWIGSREIAPDPVQTSTQEAYRQMVRDLAEIKCETVLQLSVDARGMFEHWEAEIETMLADGGEMEIMRDWGAKLAGATVRLAAVMHCVENDQAEHIEERTIAAAIEIARYLVPHAEAVLNMMLAEEDSTADDAHYVLRWIERHGLREFTKRHVHQHGKRRFRKVEDLNAPLKELEQRGYIRLRPTETTGPGRPPSPTYEVNPAVFDDETEVPSHQADTLPAEPENGNSEDVENTSESLENSNRTQVTI